MSFVKRPVFDEELSIKMRPVERQASGKKPYARRQTRTREVRLDRRRGPLLAWRCWGSTLVLAWRGAGSPAGKKASVTHRISQANDQGTRAGAGAGTVVVETDGVQAGSRTFGGQRRYSYQPMILAGLLAPYVAARVAIWSRGAIFTSVDTASYAHRGNVALDPGPVLSLTGHAPRLWGTPLFYAVFPTDTARAFAQWTLGTLAWALLAWALWGCLRSLPVRMLATAGVLVLRLTSQVVNWDFAILSESLSINLGVLAVAMLLRWLATASRCALVSDRRRRLVDLRGQSCDSWSFWWSSGLSCAPGGTGRGAGSTSPGPPSS